MLTHGHVITIITKAFNVDLSNFTRTVECSYFTKQAFVRGEIIDSAFHLIPAKTRSCWRGLAPPPPVEEHPVDTQFRDSWMLIRQRTPMMRKTMNRSWIFDIRISLKA